MDEKISTGSEVFDKLLNGGYEKDVITTIYGPPGSGKTNFCLLAMAKILPNKKVIYIDTDGSFSMARFKQIAPDYKKLLSRIIFFKPTTFDEQRDFLLKLKEAINEDIGLVVFDSAAMLYRLALGQDKDVYNVNKDLGLQISYLGEIARKKEIPVIITNQVYTDFERNNLRMVGGSVLMYSSKCLIEIQKLNGVRKAILRKHRSMPDDEILFKITSSGVEEVMKK